MDVPSNSALTPSDVNILHASGEIDVTRAFTELHLTDGRILRLNTHALGHTTIEQVDQTAATGMDTETLAIPLIEEQLRIGKRTVTTGRVILQKTVQEYEQALDEPLALRTYDIERKILSQVVESAPAVRQEGATTIYPVVEEQVILTKQLMLKEEIHVTRRDSERIDTQVVTLHREHLDVLREDVSNEGLGGRP